MELIARHGERTEKVRVRQNGEGYEVTVGDRVYQVDAATEPGEVETIVSAACSSPARSTKCRCVSVATTVSGPLPDAKA